MKFLTVLAVMSLIILAGCVTDLSAINETANSTDEHIGHDHAEMPSPHGESVSEEANLPIADGEFTSFGQSVNYGPAEGYLATPIGVENAPGVLLIHEWWGLNENIKETADRLATHGYTVLAVDLYNGELATDSMQARELIATVDQEEALMNMDAAQEYLRTTGSATIASWGFCFGGRQSMSLAVSEFAPDATIIYYGNPITDEAKLASIDQPVLGVFGDLDHAIPVDSVQDFDMKLDGVTDHDIIIYEGADHAFANPSGDRYNEQAATLAWQETLEFLAENLE